MTIKRYALIVLGVVAATLAAAWPAVPVDARAAVLCGAALSAGNTVLAYFLTVWSITRSPNVFLGVVLGGMGGRMAIMLLAVAAGVLGPRAARGAPCRRAARLLPALSRL